MHRPALVQIISSERIVVANGQRREVIWRPLPARRYNLPTVCDLLCYASCQSDIYFLVISPKMTMSVRASVQCQHFQNVKAPRPLGRGR